MRNGLFLVLILSLSSCGWISVAQKNEVSSDVAEEVSGKQDPYEFIYAGEVIAVSADQAFVVVRTLGADFREQDIYWVERKGVKIGSIQRSVEQEREFYIFDVLNAEEPFKVGDLVLEKSLSDAAGRRLFEDKSEGELNDDER